MFLLTNSAGLPGLKTTLAKLKRGESALDAIEAGIREVELNAPCLSVGHIGRPDITGHVTQDASILCGKTFRAGSVGALEGFKHPISVARAVMERLPHVMLAGDGAARFAREIGAEAVPNQPTPALQEWEKWFQALPESKRRDWPQAPLIDLCHEQINKKSSRDTTVFMAQDRAGNIAAAASTSGWGMKYPGRLGDSPVIGAGIYADNRFGAAGCTGTGEMALRMLVPHALINFRQAGQSLDKAMKTCLENVRCLQGGLLSGLVIHAIDETGKLDVVAVNYTTPIDYYHWDGVAAAAVKHEARSVKISYAAFHKSAGQAAGT
ncbi:MAG: isoaspartyl peptidase/L-asparaginase [Proteobacteria bacterium]|nr:isoaspartyl peptidase/L-asparaginase [Pseudomonadota bacterium]